MMQYQNDYNTQFQTHEGFLLPSTSYNNPEIKTPHWEFIPNQCSLQLEDNMIVKKSRESLQQTTP